MSIRDYLRNHLIRFEVLLHRPAPSATRMAETVHVPGRTVAKGVLIRAGESYVLAVLPATHLVDLPKLASLLGASELSIATEAEVMAIYVDCERGALPPFGKPYGLTSIVDSSLAAGSEIVFVANSRHEGVRMRYRDFEALETPIRGRFATMVSPKRRPQQRRAG